MSSDRLATPPKRRRRWWLRGLGLLVLLLLLAGGGFYLWQRQSLPRLSGELRLPGLEAPASLTRTAEGLTLIEAASDHDASFALGFAHAQDRLLQMDLMRRIVAGRLSEVIGSRTLEIDRFFRTLGLYDLAEANLEQLSPEARAALQAYADGVNAFLEERAGPLPVGFTLLRYEPEPWRPADSLAWGRLMALVLSSNYRDELLRARLLALLPAAKVKQLYPGWPDWAPTSVAALEGLDRHGQLRRLYDLLPWEIGPKSASNAWALAPSRSSSGGALLAGDPHLALRAPGDWYLVRIETPERRLVGATTPGVPLLIMGNNGSLAWSFTTAYGDTQDLFIEEVDPDDPGRYRTPDGWQAFERRQEVIEIDGEEPQTITVRRSRHGPIVSDVVADAEGLYPDDRVLALAWTALQEDDRSAEALYRLNRAVDLPAAVYALRDLDSPQQAMVLADARGNIGLIVPGRVPIRKAGDGLTPVPGASGDYDWTGTIPFDELPRSLNPENGVVITANNKLVGDDYPYLLAADWAYPDRATRLAEVLDGKARWSPDEMRKLQLDSLTVGGRLLLRRLLLAPLPAEAQPILDRLRAWDHQMDPDRPEPLIYSAWLRALERRLLFDELGEVVSDLATGDAWRLSKLLADDSLWCDEIGTPELESCDQQIAETLEVALKELVKAYGEDPDKWRWGKAHRARFDHPVLGYIPLLNDWTAFEVEAPGGQDTVNRGGSNYVLPFEAAFTDRHGPGLRAVHDMAAPEAAGFVIATGNSGNVFSPFYGNLVESWRDGRLLQLPKTPPADGQVLRLLPD